MSTPSPAFRLSLCLGAALALQGCNITIPSNLLAGIQTGVAVQPAKPGDKDVAPKPGDTTKPGPGTTEPGRPPVSDVGPGRVAPPIGDPVAPPPPIGQQMVDCKMDFATLDADGSGVLSAEEFVAWKRIQMPCIQSNDPDCASDLPGPYGEPKQLFLKADQSGDGQVDPGEFCTLNEALFPAPTPPTPGNGCDMSFKQADANGDGRIAPEEFMRADFVNQRQPINAAMVMPTPEVQKARFLQIDLNQDGSLDPKEWCNEDIPNDRPPYDPPVMPPIAGGNCPDDERDDDGDGMISWEEFYTKRTETIRMTEEGAAKFKEQAYAEFSKRDANGDGQLDQAERGCTGGVKPPKPPVDDACAGQFKQFDVDGSGDLSIEEYANGKWSQIRFIKAPTKEEELRMRESFRAEFKAHELDGDERLGFGEYANTCGQ